MKKDRWVTIIWPLFPSAAASGSGKNTASAAQTFSQIKPQYAKNPPALLPLLSVENEGIALRKFLKIESKPTGNA